MAEVFKQLGSLLEAASHDWLSDAMLAHQIEGLDELSRGRCDLVSCSNLATSSHQACEPQHAEPCRLGRASVPQSTILISVACCAPRDGQSSPGAMLHSSLPACQGLRAENNSGPSLQLVAVDPVALPLPASHCPPCSVPATVSPTTLGWAGLADEGFEDALRWLEACSPPHSPWGLHSPRPQPGTLPHPPATTSASFQLTCHLLLEGMAEAGATPFLAKDGALPAVATETCQLPSTCRLLVLLGHEVLVEQQVALASLLAGAGLGCESSGEQQQAGTAERVERGQAQASPCTVAGAGSCAAVPSGATLPHCSQAPGPELLEVQLEVPQGCLAAALQRHARLRSASPFQRPGPGCGSGAAEPGLAAPAGQLDRPSRQAAPWGPAQSSPLPRDCCGAVALKVLLLPGLSDDSLATRPRWTCDPTAAPRAGSGPGCSGAAPEAGPGPGSDECEPSPVQQLCEDVLEANPSLPAASTRLWGSQVSGMVCVLLLPAAATMELWQHKMDEMAMRETLAKQGPDNPTSGWAGTQQQAGASRTQPGGSSLPLAVSMVVHKSVSSLSHDMADLLDLTAALTLRATGQAPSFGDTTTIALGPGAAAQARRLHGSLLDFFTLAELPACRLLLHDLQPSPPASSRASWDSAASGSAPSPCPFPTRPAAVTRGTAIAPAAPLAAAGPAGPPGGSGMVGEVVGWPASMLVVPEQSAEQVPDTRPGPLRRAMSVLQPGQDLGTRLVQLPSWE